MAVAKLRDDWTFEIPEELRDGPGLFPGDTVRVERVAGGWQIQNADPVSVLRAILARAQNERRSGVRDPAGTLPPVSAAEEAAIERYDRIVREQCEQDDK